MNKVVVIGAGASGMIAAILASKNNNAILLESNDKCGKKILLTGNGRCNYWNEDINITKYNTDNKNNLNEIIKLENQKEVLSYLESIGIYPKIKNGYYYPYSNQSSSIREILLKELKINNVNIVNNFKVENIHYENNKYIIKSIDKEFIADKVILATGSKAFPKTGSDGSGYDIATKLGHKLNFVTPSLTSLIAEESYLKDWAGVRCDVLISLYINDEKIKEETGEIQLTNYGISGICTFNISGIVSKNLKLGKNVKVKINFLPDINNSFYDWFTNRNNNIPNHTIEELLESLINYKLMFVILKKANINKDLKWNDLSEKDKIRLSKTIEEFDINIVDTEDFDRAQVCTGGISLEEINPNTMESKILPNLYITGELLDVDGICGGFNLAFAWISGYLAGKDV